METERATTESIYRIQSSQASGYPNSVARKAVGDSGRVVASASADYRAQIFLGFARFPVARVVGEDCVTQTLVQFADLRYTEPGRGRGTFSLDVPVECPALERR